MGYSSFSPKNHRIGWDDADWFSPADLDNKTNTWVDSFEVGNIQLYFGDALEILPQIGDGDQEITCQNPYSSFQYHWPKTFDVVFIDGQFVDTLKFYQSCLPLLNTWWKIIVDDAIKYAWKMEWFFEYLDENTIDYSIEKIDEDDGLAIISNGDR